MDFLEKDLEQILFESKHSDLMLKGLILDPYQKMYRQFNINGYGVIDLMSIYFHRQYRQIDINVFELKNKTLNIDAFMQLIGYMNGVKQVVNTIKRNLNINKLRVRVTGTLIGKDIEQQSNFCFLPTIQSNIEMFTFSYGLNGINFKKVEDTYYRSKYNGFDEYKLQFNSIRDFLLLNEVS